MEGMRLINIKNKIGLLLLTIIFVLVACSTNDEELIRNDEEQETVNNEENQNGTNNEVDNAEENEAEKAFTISGMEATPFEDIEGKTAVKLYPDELSIPYDLEEFRWKMYYGDNEFISYLPNEGFVRMI